MNAPFPSVRLAPLALLVALSVTLAGCGLFGKIAPSRTPAQPPAGNAKPGGYYLDDGPGENPPANLAQTPDAVPRDEPLNRAANRPYSVFGRTYVPSVAPSAFRQTGIASWYGRKFHGQKTSIGETYDMYAMTAAHPTLPLPCYVRVTNEANGKSVIVRVNDRGPFHSDRIIDLSYTAAYKLGISGKGSGMVTVERVFPGMTVAAAPDGAGGISTAVPANSTAVVSVLNQGNAISGQPLPETATPIQAEAGGIYIQLGAFSTPENAASFRDKMQRDLDWMREPITVVLKDRTHRVRIGPLANREEAQAIADKVRATMNIAPIVGNP